MRPLQHSSVSVALVHQGYRLVWHSSHVPATDMAQLTGGSIQPQLSSYQNTIDAALRHCQITVNIGVSGGILVLIKIHGVTKNK